MAIEGGKLLITPSATPEMNHTIIAVDMSGSCEKWYPELEKVIKAASNAGCVVVVFSSAAITHGLENTGEVDLNKARRMQAYGYGTSFSAPLAEVKQHAVGSTNVFFFTDGNNDSGDKPKAQRALGEIHAILQQGAGKFTTVFTQTDPKFGSPDPEALQAMCFRSNTQEFPVAGVEAFLRNLLGATVGERHDAKTGAVTVGAFTTEFTPECAPEFAQACGRDIVHVPDVREALAVCASVVAFFTRNHERLAPKDLLKVNVLLARFNNTPAAAQHGVQDVINRVRALAAKFGAEKAAAVSNGLQALLAGRGVVARGAFSQADVQELAALLHAAKTGAANNPLPGTRQNAAQKAMMKFQAGAGQSAQRLDKVLSAHGQVLASAVLFGPTVRIEKGLADQLQLFRAKPERCASVTALIQAPENLQFEFVEMRERHGLEALPPHTCQVVTRVVDASGVAQPRLPVELLQPIASEIGAGLISGTRAPYLVLNGLFHPRFDFEQNASLADAVIGLVRDYTRHVTKEPVFNTAHPYVYGKSLSSDFPIPCGPRALLLLKRLQDCQVDFNHEQQAAQQLMGLVHAVATDGSKPYMQEAKLLVLKVCSRVKLNISDEEAVSLLIDGVRAKAGDPLHKVLPHVVHLKVDANKQELLHLAKEAKGLLQAHEWKKPLVGVAPPVPPFSKITEALAYSFKGVDVRLEDLVDFGLGIASVKLGLATLLTGTNPSHQDVAAALENTRSEFDVYAGRFEVTKPSPLPAQVIAQSLAARFNLVAGTLPFWRQCAVATVFSNVQPDLSRFGKAPEDESHFHIVVDWALKCQKLPHIMERAFMSFTGLDITCVQVATAYLERCALFGDLRTLQNFSALDKSIELLGESAAKNPHVETVFNTLNFIDLAGRLRKLKRPLPFRFPCENGQAYADFVFMCAAQDVLLIARSCFIPAVLDRALRDVEDLLHFDGDAPSKAQTELAQVLGNKLPQHLSRLFGKQVSEKAGDIARNYFKEVVQRNKLRRAEGCEPTSEQIYAFLTRDKLRAMSVEDCGRNLPEFLANMWREFNAKKHRGGEDRRVAAQIVQFAKYQVDASGQVSVHLPLTYLETE